ncbi:MAG: hypothetical protein ABI878_07615 [Acidobacteriota bacterium]
MVENAGAKPERGHIAYRINDEDVIVDVGGSWDEFASENDSPDIMAKNVLGRKIWDFISDETLRHLYSQIITKVRNGTAMKFDFRCDAPDERRYLRMSIEPATGGSVQFETRQIQVTPRPPSVEFAAGTAGTGATVIACSWCNRIRTDEEEWVELEDAVERLQLFAVNPRPTLSHGICGVCKTNVMQRLLAS